MKPGDWALVKLSNGAMLTGIVEKWSDEELLLKSAYEVECPKMGTLQAKLWLDRVVVEKGPLYVAAIKEPEWLGYGSMGLNQQAFVIPAGTEPQPDPLDELKRAVVKFCVARYEGTWVGGNPDHCAGGEPEDELYNAAVRACRRGLISREVK